MAIRMVSLVIICIIMAVVANTMSHVGARAHARVRRFQDARLRGLPPGEPDSGGVSGGLRGGRGPRHRLHLSRPADPSGLCGEHFSGYGHQPDDALVGRAGRRHRGAGGRGVPDPEGDNGADRRCAWEGWRETSVGLQPAQPAGPANDHGPDRRGHGARGVCLRGHPHVGRGAAAHPGGLRFLRQRHCHPQVLELGSSKHGVAP